jgi:hypothetical protein
MPVVPPSPILKPTSTIPGLVVPPPIPGPPHSPPTPSPGSPPLPSTTLLGVQAKKPSIPTIPTITKKSPTTPPPPPLAEKDEVVDAPSGLLEIDDSGPIRVPHVPLSDDGTLPPLDPTSNALHRFDTNAETNVPATQVRLPKPTPGQNFESQTGEMSKGMLEQLQRKATMATSDIAPLAPPPEAPPPKSTPTSTPEEEPVTLVKEAEPSPSSTLPGTSAPSRTSTPPAVITPPPAAATPPRAATSSSQIPQSSLPKVALGVLLLGVLGAGGYYLYTTQLAPKNTPEVVATTPLDAAT